MSKPREHLQEHLAKLAMKHNLTPYLPELVEQSIPCVGLTTHSCEEDEILCGAPKLGGRPDVPPAFQWPRYRGRPLSFLVQIDLSFLPESCRGQLPAAGLLQFFYDYNSFAGEKYGEEFFKVLYHNEPVGTLRRVSPPELPHRKIMFGLFKVADRVRQFKPCKITFEETLSLPWENDRLTATDELSDSYYELLEEVGAHHRVLGFPEPIQSPMELECELVSRGRNWSYYSGLSETEKQSWETAARRWKLLLQLDSDTEMSDMMWGDAGRLYFFIPEESLAERRFEDTWLVVQCY